MTATKLLRSGANNPLPGLGLLAALMLAGALPAARADEPEEPVATSRPAVEQYVKIGAHERVTMHVSGLPIADAVRLLSEPTKKNIIVAEGVKGTVTASLYDVEFEDALKAMLLSSKLAYREEGSFIVIYPQDELAKINEASRRLISRVFRLSYVNAAAIKPLIEPMLSKVGKIAVTPPSSKGLGGSNGSSGGSGGGSGSGGSSGGSGGSASGVTTEGDALASPDTLLITDFAEQLDEIAKVIHDLDQRPKQVLIEATILRAALNEDNALGVDFTTVGGIDFADVGSVSPAAQSITTGNIPTPQLQNTNFTFRNDLNSALPAGGFTFGILKDQVGVFVRALEQITDTSVLANPKVLALNKQVGHVLVGRRDGYLTTTVTETTAVQKVEFLETGTVLSYRPFINDDGTVRMEIHPKDSTGGLTDANLPFEQTTEVTSNIFVKDGHTILIGGLFREVSSAARGQIPLLGNIPVAGVLFRRTRDTTTREEVIVLLTVHIVKGDEDGQAGAELRQDVERFRVGMRQGIQWFGRERLAEAHYRWAVEHFSKGHTGRALWDAELALNNYPRNIDAMKLKEKILCKRDWEDEATSIRHYMIDRINEEEGTWKPPFGRPTAPPFPTPELIEGASGFDEDEDDDPAPAAASGESPSAGNESVSCAIPTGERP